MTADTEIRNRDYMYAFVSNDEMSAGLWSNSEYEGRNAGDVYKRQIHKGTEVKKVAVLGGFVEILQEKITVLAEGVQWPEEIDVERAKRAEARARERLEQKEDVYKRQVLWDKSRRRGGSVIFYHRSIWGRERFGCVCTCAGGK